MKNSLLRNVEILQGGGISHLSCRAVFLSLFAAFLLSSCGDDDLPSPEGVKSSSGEPVILCDVQEPGIGVTVETEWDGVYNRDF